MRLRTRSPAESARARPMAPLLLLLSCSCAVAAVVGFPFRTPPDLDVTPRVTVLSSGLQGCRRFRSSAVNYSTLLLEADSERLYVGARGAVFALSASDISASSALTIEWEASTEQKRECVLKGKDDKTECFNHIRLLQRFNSTHLYMCGTHAFKPLCAYIDEKKFVMSSQPEEGRDRCPYGPTTGYTALIIDQQIYTASQYEFWRFPDIRRNSPSPSLRTEDAPTRWLNEADFVGSALVRESLGSSAGDDDKIYFFFTEKSQEQSTTYSHSRVARVGRICKGDRGGLLTLQKRWTSFLKSRLTCSLPEYDFHFNMLRSVFVMHGLTPKDTLFYGIFGLEWKNVKASAVCRFSLPEVQTAFQGPYMENQDSSWREYVGKIPNPRPGTCITDALKAKGINISTSLPDDVLDFVRRHPLMSNEIQPVDRRPLLFMRTTDYTQMAVRTVQGLDEQTYHVLYMGTDEGWLHKAVNIKGQLHIIEEVQLFEEPQPVLSLLLSTKQMSVYASSESGVIQLPLSNCRRYASCYECIFARDPDCAWDGAECVDVMTQANRSTLIQDIHQGRTGCEKTQYNVVQRSRSVRVGNDVLLQCELSSNLATPLWMLNGTEVQGYDLNSGFRTGTDGLLIIKAQQDQSGLYACHAIENNIKVAVVTYNVTIELDPTLPPAEPTHSPVVTLPALSTHSSSENSSSKDPHSPLPLLSPKNMEVVYLSLITILGALCVVLGVVLAYLGFCLRVGQRGKYSLRAAAAAHPSSKKNRKHHRNSSSTELKTISSHCNGNGFYNGVSKRQNADAPDEGLLYIVPGEGQTSLNKEPPPPAPPLPPTPQFSPPECDFPNGLSATLPSVLRRMNGNSYVLLRQSDSENTSPLCYPFADELNKILEKRKHTLLLPRPDESSV
ncbi:semaphorin-4G [Austrofundulus limnaeus]|uniref:Semaphorin-4G n=1 Tax=Austrofundulus limnaeus TaxID=52670 RepID=A0A2I4CTS6_AUSLI|nr:PREDICTED: semaphorin-4G-like [Austrofundulus limnaeus]